MRLRLPHAPYIADKISRDIVHSDFVEVLTNIESISHVAKKYLEEDIKKEAALEERVLELLEENEEEIEFMRLNEKELFRMAKKKLAGETGFIMSWDERFNELAHKIMDELIDESHINFEVSENKVKNTIFKAIEGYLKSFEEIEDTVLKRIDNYKRKLIPGTEEYDIVFEKLYEEELRKKGFL